VEFLCERGADVNRGLRSSSLHYAACFGRPQIVKVPSVSCSVISVVCNLPVTFLGFYILNYLSSNLPVEYKVVVSIDILIACTCVVVHKVTLWI